MDLLQYAASLPEGSGQWNSRNAVPHRLRAVGSGTPAMHCLTAWGQWAVDLPQCTAQGVVVMSCRACGEAAVSKNRAHRPGGTGSPAQGVVGVSFWAHGEAALSKNRARRPRGDGECSPGGGQSILHGPWGGNFVQKLGTPAWGDGESSPGGGRSIFLGPWGGGIV